MAQQKRFAYGANSCGGCPCPVSAAGEDPDSRDWCEIAEEYDNQVFSRNPSIGDYTGVIDADEAREAFAQAIEQLRKMDEYEKAERARELWTSVFDMDRRD